MTTAPPPSVPEAVAVACVRENGSNTWLAAGALLSFDFLVTESLGPTDGFDV